MQYKILGKTGYSVSVIGLGGAPLGGDFGPVTDDEAIEVVHAALDLGINFVDTAPLYGAGESERRVGLALKGKRDKVYLATKAVMRGDPYTYDNTIASVEGSLKRLQTDYVDLIQLHELDQITTEQAMNETLPAFRKLKEEGKIRAIGVNANEIDRLLPFIEAGLTDTVQMFSRYTPIDYTAADKLLPAARQHNVGVIQGSPLVMGVLADAPAPFMLTSEELMAEGKRRMDLVAFLGSRERGGLIEASMRFSLTCPDIAVTLTGTAKAKNLLRNAAYADGVGLTDEQMERVLALFPGQRYLAV